MVEIGKLFGKVPYIVRKETEGYWSIQQVEKLITEAIQNTLVSPQNIAQVYIDNKYNPQNIQIEVYDGIIINKDKTVELQLEDIKDENGEGIPIIINFVSSTTPLPNIVKDTCKELGMTYKELGEAIGVKESTLNKIASTGVVSDQIQKAISLYLETIELKKQLKDCDVLKQALKNLIK